MIEAQRVASFVFDRLAADTGAGGVSTLVGGRIYRDEVPQTVPLPAITVTLVSAVDENTLGGRRVFQQVLVDVRVVNDGSVYATSIADRVDAVLQNVGGVQASVVSVVELRRRATEAYIEHDAGKSYAHLIQTYRSESHATA